MVTSLIQRLASPSFDRPRFDQTLLEILPVAVYVCDRDGTVLHYNRRAAELWGRAPDLNGSAERYCGSHKIFLRDGTHVPHAECPMAEVLRNGRPVTGQEVIFERPDGSRVVCLAHLTALRNEGGEIVGAVNCFHDISEQKRAAAELAERRQALQTADAALRDRERHYRDLLEALPAAVYTTDAAGRITFYNRAAAELAGREPQLGSDEWCVTWRLFQPDGTPMPHDECPMAIALKENRPVRGAEAVAERPDGRRVPFIPYPTPLRDSSGALVGAVNMLVDISERKAAEAALREESRTLETLNRTGAALAAELDLDRIVQIVTDAATELSGAAFGAFFYNVLDEHGESYMLYALSGVAREAVARFPAPRNTAVFDPTFRGEGIIRSADILNDPRYGKNPPYYGMPPGHLPVRSYLAVPVVSRSSEVFGGLFFGHPEPGVFTERAERVVAGIAAQAAIAIDNGRLYQAAQREIAARKRAEEDLQRLNETLEQRVEERTRQLRAEIEERKRAEAALRQSQKLEALGQLTSGVAHDFNNLLSAVMGNLELLEKRTRDEGLLKLVRSATRAAERGAKLNERLLAFARKQHLAPKPVDLNRLVAGMETLLHGTLGGAIRIETIFGRDLWPALADPSQIELVVLNLAINARDAMAIGGTLMIEAANVTLGEPERATDPPPGDYVMVAVTDTGTGMSEEVVAKAFEPFFTTKAPGKGSGLGLAMVYGVARQSGGGVRIDSRLGEGTSVKVYLPRAAAGTEQQQRTAAAAEESEAAGATILLVDDDSDVREVATAMLLDLGYHVVAAGSGRAALDLLEQGQAADLLLVDVAMPGMTGLEVARIARERRPALPVIFATGYVDAIALGSSIDGGLVINKPFRQGELAARIRDLLREASIAASANVLPLRVPRGP